MSLKKTLKIKRHVVRPNWLLADETLRLFNALQGQTPKDEPQALFVGGCVRNILLEHEVDDFDIATLHHPDAVMKILEAEGIKVIPTGIDHGTITAVIGDYVYEITTLRHDKETDGRHAVVAFTDSWIEDARRRDFTMNTLLMDLQGNIYDPLECGLGDLDARCVRFVGEAAQRIEEDYLRILRFFRFSAQYGGVEFDVQGLSACRKHASGIKNLSKERITQEFFKIIASDKPYKTINTMFEHGILSEFVFSNENTEFFEHFCNFQSRYRLSALSSRLFVFAHMGFDNIKSMEEFILFPKVFLKDMKAIAGALSLPDLSSDHAVRESVYRFGRSITAQALMIELVQDRVMNAYAPAALDIVQNWDVPNFSVSGNDLMAGGMKAGPQMGRELTRLEDEWIANGFS
ncbi:MAG: poly A polymerase head domain-containing protein [Zetaproteobacteria bacterium]|nr:MAG: poly A polymerase head domain-containing protein [Zetaproteobacteria bacterium]